MRKDAWFPRVGEAVSIEDAQINHDVPAGSLAKVVDVGVWDRSSRGHPRHATVTVELAGGRLCDIEYPGRRAVANGGTSLRVMPSVEKEEIARWATQGLERGAAYLLIVRDVFENDDFPVYARSQSELSARCKEFEAKSVCRIVEIYDLQRPLSEQFAARRAWVTLLN